MLACLTVQESTKVIGRKWEKVGKCARGSNSVTGAAQPQSAVTRQLSAGMETETRVFAGLGGVQAEPLKITH